MLLGETFSWYCQLKALYRGSIITFVVYHMKVLILYFISLFFFALKFRNMIYVMFVDPCIIVQFIKKNPTRCNNVSKFYYSTFIWSSTCFGRHTAHHQEPKTALAASGISYVEGCWTCSWLDVVRHTVPDKVHQLHVQQPSK